MNEMSMDGTLETVGGRPTLRFERRLRHPVEKVWRALTDPAELEHWFPQRVEGATSADGEIFVPGGKLRFPFRERAELGGEPVPDFEGEVLEVDPPRLLAYTWGEDVLRFELTPDGEGGCVLVFTDTIADVGKASRDSAGWHTCLAYLVARLDGAPPADDRWQDLYDAYVAAFGPEAATAPLPTSG